MSPPPATGAPFLQRELATRTRSTILDPPFMIPPRCTLAFWLVLSLPGMALAADPVPPLAPTPPETFVKSAAPPVDITRDKALYTVGYAHLDTQWRWTYPQVIREYIANTLHDNFKLIEKYPNYTFNFSGSRRYEMMREYYPAEYERLKGYIAAGRWFPCGSSVDENDANVPGLESMRAARPLRQPFLPAKEFGVVEPRVHATGLLRVPGGAAVDPRALRDQAGFPRKS